MAEGTLTASDAEEILKGLSRQERLDLLERLIRGGPGSEDDEPTIDERIDRLERAAWGDGCGCRRGHRRRGSSGRRSCGCS